VYIIAHGLRESINHAYRSHCNCTTVDFDEISLLVDYMYRRSQLQKMLVRAVLYLFMVYAKILEKHKNLLQAIRKHSLWFKRRRDILCHCHSPHLLGILLKLTNCCLMPCFPYWANVPLENRQVHRYLILDVSSLVAW
jgi:hypothetical protein